MYLILLLLMMGPSLANSARIVAMVEWAIVGNLKLSALQRDEQFPEGNS